MGRVAAPPKRVLRRLAKDRHWEQHDVTQRSGLSRAMVSVLFNEKREKVDESTIQALVAAFGVPPARLYGYDGQDNGCVSADKNLDLYISLDNALKAEFTGSALEGNLVDTNLRRITSLLRDTGARNDIQKHFAATDDVLKKARVTDMPLPGDALRKALKGRTISIATNAMECGTVAALLLARDLLHRQGIELQVDFSRIHGGDLTRALNEGRESYDFAVLGFSPMYLDLAIYVRRSDYFLLTPVHGAFQCVYSGSEDSSRLKLAYYLARGSGELQRDWAEFTQPPLALAFEELRDRRTFSVAKALERGEGVIAYCALGTTLEDDFGLKRVGGTSFDIHVCLFANKQVGQDSALAKAFTAAFSRVYVACRRNRRLARELLWNDILYPRLYASGAGIVVNEDR